MSIKMNIESAGNMRLGQTAPMSSFWMALWAVFFSLAWLLPNHYPPWSTFHLDAWTACVMLLPALWLTIAQRARTPWTTGQLLVLALALVPALQYAAGLVVHAGTAWVNTAYLLGFLLAWQTGARWESAGRDQPADGLLLAIGLAAFVSVGLQLHQWLQLDRLDIWSMGGTSGRPYANLGQPNQLGTLLIWGLLALLWSVLRQRVRPAFAVAGAVFVLFGLALTGSRTAWLAVLLLNIAVWCWQRHWPSRKTLWVVTALTLYFFVVAFSIDVLPRILILLSGAPEYHVSDIVRTGTETRPAIWAMFLDAVLQRPWWGYGWGQVAKANIAVALDHPAQHVYFSHAHNLFLDLILWTGLPLGIAVSSYLVWWFVSRALRVRTAQDATLFMLVLVVANHAMLELPLHHAYFLLPTGLVMGALEVRLGVRPVVRVTRWVSAALALSAAVLLALIVRDYLRVESVYQDLRYEWAGIKTPPVQPPDVLLLTQWREFVRYARFEPVPGMAADQLEWMRRVTSLFPSAGHFQKMAAALASNGQPDEAGLWLRKACKMVSNSQCAALKSAWEDQALHDPRIAAVVWPN